jgi:outer membrane lipoprotein LolB
LLRFVPFACAVLAIAGCSQFANLAEQQHAQALWASQQQEMAKYNDWDMHSRAVVKLEAGVYNIGIRWQRDPDSFMMLLEAPLGQGVFRIESKPGEAYRLRLPDGRVFENLTAEALLEDVIGWSLPISGLDYWIRGMPRPGSVYSHRVRADGRTRSIKQDQWVISYLDYFEQQEDPRLPRKIKLVNDTIAIRLVVERWQPAKQGDSRSDLFPEFN